MASLNTSGITTSLVNWTYLSNHANNTSTKAHYNDGQGSTPKLWIELNSNGDLLLYVNGGPTAGYPTSYKINGSVVSDGSVIAANDAIDLLFSDGTTAHSFTVGSNWVTAAGGLTVSGTHTPATGTQSHNYVQDSIRDITCSKTAAYQIQWEFKHRDISSAPYNSAMGQNAVTYTSTNGRSGATVQYTFSQVDSTNTMTITSSTQFPNSEHLTGDVSTLTADIDLQVDGGSGTWNWVTAGQPLATYTYEATNVVYTVGSGYVGDTVTIEVTDTNQFPDYDNDISLSYSLDNPPTNHQGSSLQMTNNVFSNMPTGHPWELNSANNYTMSGTWVVGDDGSSSPTGLSGTLTGYRTTPTPQQLQISVFTRAYTLSPYGQSGSTRRRAHSFW